MKTLGEREKDAEALASNMLDRPVDVVITAS